MKSPRQLSQQLAKQWQSADKREQRLLTNSPWPLRLAIAKPTSAELKNSVQQVAQHIKQWRNESLATVEWQFINYQATSQAIEIPIYWLIENTSQWIAACRDATINSEYNMLSNVINQVDPQFHQLIVRQKNLSLKTTQHLLIQACALTLQLQPSCAQGKPLRALALANIDTKFIETHRQLITKLLNQRFNLSLNSHDLEHFLGAASNNEHWLLVVPLDDKLLPFKQMRLRASELQSLKLPCHSILIVENEQCQYQLPPLENCIAILGAGLNLSWLSNPSFKTKKLGYWGDIDSWGLKMLAMAREYQSHIMPLLMDEQTFDQHQKMAVEEPQTAGNIPPVSLNKKQQQFYNKLIGLKKGRLEQEFIEESVVKKCLQNWHH